RQGQIGKRLDELDRLRQDGRLVGQRDAGVDVEHVRAGRDLGQDVALHAAEVARLHLLGQDLPPGGVDALADDHERPVRPDHHLAGHRADDGQGHPCSSAAGLAAVVDAAGVVGLPVDGASGSSAPPVVTRWSRTRRVYVASRRATSAVAAASRSSPQGRWTLCHSAMYSSIERRPAFTAARSMATWKRGWRTILLARRPSLATTWAGMSHHQMTVN